MNQNLKKKWFLKFFNLSQFSWMKPYTNLSNEIGKLMSNSVFGKTMEINEKHGEKTFVTKNERRNYLVSGPNYHLTQQISEKLLVIELTKQKQKMSKSNQSIYISSYWILA